MTRYHAIAHLTTLYSDELALELVDELADYHPVVSGSPYGRPEVILTVEAESLRRAIVTALAVVHAAGHDTYSIEVLPTEAFDQGLGLDVVPDLLSVSEVAEQLGVTRQAVQQRIDAGTLPARRVGKTYAVPSVAVSRAVQAMQEHVSKGEGFKAVQAAARAAAQLAVAPATTAAARTPKSTKAE